MVKGFIDRGQWGPIDGGSSEVFRENLFNDLPVVLFTAEEVEVVKSILKDINLDDWPDQEKLKKAYAILEGE